MCLKRIALLPLLLLFALALPAQISISGAILAGGGGGQDAFPVPEFPVLITSPDNQESWTVHTDSAGIFSFFDPSVVTTPGDIWTVVTFDPCNLLEPSENIVIEEGNSSYSVVFNICTDFHPPAPLDTCIASLSFELFSSNTPTVQFHNTSTTTQSTSVVWDFGDGQSSVENNPLHTYEEYGSYEVTLTITGDSCVATTTETVQVDSIPCDCDITFDLQVCVVDEVTGEITVFGDICDAFCAGFQAADILICPSDSSCFANFQPVIDPEDIFTITFENTSFFIGELDSVYWDFGDGTLSTELSPTHTYAEEGTYDVQLTIFNGACSDTRFLPITVAVNPPLPCDCDLSFDFPVCVLDEATGELIVFEDICDALCAGYGDVDLFVCSSDSSCTANFSAFPDPEDDFTVNFENTSFFSGTLDSIFWDFGDGSVSTENNPTYTYQEAGTFQVLLTIFNEDCLDTRVGSVTVGPSPSFDDCQAFFVFEQPDPENLLTYQFFGFSITGVTDSMLWDFGNGVSSTESSPLYTYNEAGTYQVSLTIFSGVDCVSTLAIVINVGDNVWYGNQECRASFLPLIIGDSTEVYFWNTSSSDAISYEWDFGDGNTSTEFEPFYVFPAPAVYTVTLTTTNQDGCVNDYMVIIDLANNNFTSMPQFTLLSNTRATSPAAEDIQVFPNPSPAIFTISWSAAINSGSVNWQLMDISGRVIEQRKSLNNGRFQIDLGDRPDGVYFLRMESETGTTTKRLIKS